MSEEGTKRIIPKKQTLDEAYCPPGELWKVKPENLFIRTFTS